MGLMDKIKGNHAHDSTTHNTAGSAYDKGATTHHAGAPVGTTQGTNTTGAAYGVPTGRSAIPGQEPYATRSEQHTGLTGSHGDQYNNTSTGHHGLTGSDKHSGSTLPGGAAGYGGQGQDTRAPGTYNTQDNYGREHGTSHDSGLTGHHDKHSSSGGGLLGRKKDDLEESLSREQKAKAELDAAMARHNEARTHADQQLTAKEKAAEAELQAAQERLRKAQELRQQAGH